MRFYSQREKYTVIEDIMEGPYGQSLNNYNSNATTGISLPGDKVKRSNYIPQEYLQSIRSNYPDVTPQRDVSLDQAVKFDQQLNPPMVNSTLYPSTNYGGVSPPMNDLGKDNGRIEMKEFYQMPSGQTCVDTLNHVSSCPLCSNYFKCDTKVYNVIIIMLIIIFAIIMFFTHKEEKR